MSETVYYTGKLFEVERYESETLEQQAGRLLASHNKEPEGFYDSLTEQLCDDLGLYILANDKIYTYTQDGGTDDKNIFDAIENVDGSISYQVKYYNGGCGFSEAIETAMEKLK